MNNWLVHLIEWIRREPGMEFPNPFENYHYEMRPITDPYYTCIVCGAHTPADDWCNPETGKFEKLP